MSWVKISSTSFSAAASVSVDNCFSATYTHYLVTRNLLGSSAGSAIHLRLRVSGTDDTAANYRFQWLDATSTTITGGRATGQTLMSSALGSIETTSFGFAQLKISNPFEAVRTTMWNSAGYTQSGNIMLESNVFAHDLASSYTGFTAIPAAGTITGSITVYGLRAS